MLTTASHRTHNSTAAARKNVEVLLKKKLSKNMNEIQGCMKSQEGKMKYIEP